MQSQEENIILCAQPLNSSCIISLMYSELRCKPSHKPSEILWGLLFPRCLARHHGMFFCCLKISPSYFYEQFSSICLRNHFCIFYSKIFVKILCDYLYCALVKAVCWREFSQAAKSFNLGRGWFFPSLICFWGKKCFLQQNVSHSKFVWFCPWMFLDCFLLSLTKAVHHASNFWFIFTALQMLCISYKRSFITSVLI